MLKNKIWLDPNETTEISTNEGRWHFFPDLSPPNRRTKSAPLAATRTTIGCRLQGEALGPRSPRGVTLEPHQGTIKPPHAPVAVNISHWENEEHVNVMWMPITVPGALGGNCNHINTVCARVRVASETIACFQNNFKWFWKFLNNC